jgi:5S rRNA maturation endonuclease (ribonuclease M5)
LSTHLKDKLEKIEKILTQLTEESARGKLIVVEGKKDAQTIRDLGVKGTVLTLKTGGKSFLEATAEIENLCVGEVILLLDFDRRGVEGTKCLQRNLERLKIRPNVRFWHALHAIVGREIHSIESMSNYLQTLYEKAGK